TLRGTRVPSSHSRRGGLLFQAEDGIRERNVTGVQTCALPISSCVRPVHAASSPRPTWATPRRGRRRPHTTRWPPTPAGGWVAPQIGRASWRERVAVAEAAGGAKAKGRGGGRRHGALAAPLE